MKRSRTILLKRGLAAALLSAVTGLSAADGKVLKDHGIPAGRPNQVLPSNAIVHAQIKSPRDILENLERFILDTVPEKAVPPPMQSMLEQEHPVLAMLGMGAIQAPLTADAVAQHLGLNLEAPITFTLYPGNPRTFFILSLPVVDLGVLERTLQQFLHPQTMTEISVGGRPMARIELGHGFLSSVFVACSADRAYFSGEPSLLLHLFDTSTGFPRLAEDEHIARVIEYTSGYDVWFTFYPEIVKPWLTQLPFFKYLPETFLAQARQDLLKKIPENEKEQIEQRLRLQLGVKSLEELADYIECAVTATYEQLFDYLYDNLTGFRGFSVALTLDHAFPQVAVFLHSDAIDREGAGRPIPMEDVREALAWFPEDMNHVTIRGQAPRPEPAQWVTAWLARTKSLIERKGLDTGLMDTLIRLQRETARPAPLASRVPWIVRTSVAVHPPPPIDHYETLEGYLTDLFRSAWSPCFRPVALVPGGSVQMLEDVFSEKYDGLRKNRQLAEDLFGDRVRSPFFQSLNRITTRKRDHGVREFILEDAIRTRGGFFGYNEHELISRKIYYAKESGGYLMFHQASGGPGWLGDFHPEGAGKLDPGLSRLLDRIPEGANFVTVHRCLNRIPDVVDWLGDLEDLVHREIDDYLQRIRARAGSGIEDDQVARAVAEVKFALPVYSVNRDQDTGTFYCLLPGNGVYPRPKIVPRVKALLAEFRDQARYLGGIGCYTRVLPGTCEASLLVNTEAFSMLIKTVGNAIAENYLYSPNGMADLRATLVPEKDRDPKRLQEVLLRNPSWEFLRAMEGSQRGRRPRVRVKAQPRHKIRARSHDASAEQMDLSSYYNASPEDAWHAGGVANNNLESLPLGLQQIAGVTYDIRGIVQLSGQQAARELIVGFPQRVDGIGVHQKCGRLHFLHATGWPAEDGTRIATYVIHYADGQWEEAPILYGRQVKDWWTRNGEAKVSGSEIAWAGRNGAGRTVHLYHTVWENPRPAVEIARIDYVSAMSNSAPFLIAITAE